VRCHVEEQPTLRSEPQSSEHRGDAAAADAELGIQGDDGGVTADASVPMRVSSKD
jgi:hypothetical protein